MNTCAMRMGIAGPSVSTSYSSRHSCTSKSPACLLPQRRRLKSSLVIMANWFSKEDKSCRDMVGERRDVASSGKVFKLRFLASGGEYREADCPDNMYILDAADKAGIDLPATCRGGICGACVARVAKGSVDSSDIPDLEFTVTTEEQAKGMALLCMSRPTADCEIETQSDWGLSLGFEEWKVTGRFEATPDPLMGGKLGVKK